MVLYRLFKEDVWLKIAVSGLFVVLGSSYYNSKLDLSMWPKQILEFPLPFLEDWRLIFLALAMVLVVFLCLTSSTLILRFLLPGKASSKKALTLASLVFIAFGLFYIVNNQTIINTIRYLPYNGSPYYAQNSSSTQVGAQNYASFVWGRKYVDTFNGYLCYEVLTFDSDLSYTIEAENTRLDLIYVFRHLLNIREPIKEQFLYTSSDSMQQNLKRLFPEKTMVCHGVFWLKEGRLHKM